MSWEDTWTTTSARRLLSPGPKVSNEHIHELRMRPEPLDMIRLSLPGHCPSCPFRPAHPESLSKRPMKALRASLQSGKGDGQMAGSQDLADRLWQDSHREILQALHHPFIRQLGSGSLPRYTSCDIMRSFCCSYRNDDRILGVLKA